MKKPNLPRWLRIAQIILGAQRNRWRFRRGVIQHPAGATSWKVPAAESVRYIQQVFSDFLHFGQLETSDFAGASVLEIGPGDNVGVLLLFLVHGAGRAWAVDKYYALRDPETERQIYLELRQGLSVEMRQRFDEIVDLQHGQVRFDTSRLSVVHGLDAGKLEQALADASVDLVLSRAVLQEIRDITPALCALDRVLKPGGRMIHKIDLRDHGMFSALGFHPREFLTISEGVYRWMSDDGKHNRKMLDYYRAQMKELGYEARFYLTAVIEESYPGQRPETRQLRLKLEPGLDYGEAEQRMVEAIRPRLIPAYQNLTDEELLTASTMLVARKPESAR